jgi:hypothetical protein
MLTVLSSSAITMKSAGGGRVLLMLVFGEKQCHCPATTQLLTCGACTGRPFDARSRIVTYESPPDGRGPVESVPFWRLRARSPAEISVHAEVNEPISGGKRSSWTNRVWPRRGDA